MDIDIRERNARIRLISMFFVRCANDYWTNIYTLKSDVFRSLYWSDVNEAFGTFWKKVRRDNDSNTEDAICELADMTDDKLIYIYSNVFNSMSGTLGEGSDLELCTRVYIFDIFLTAAYTFAKVMGDDKSCRVINRIREAMSRFMGNFKFPYQSETDGSKVYDSIDPYLRQFIDFLKTVKINVK